MADLSSQPQALAFLRDIIDNPEDDTPRLVFADWLDEHGDADLEPLLTSSHLANLHRLTVWSIHGSQAFRKKLEARFPKVLA
jgi:uncharacterized protein (TIGR02996 family)